MWESHEIFWNIKSSYIPSSTPWPSQFGIQKCQTVSAPFSSPFSCISFFFLSSITKMRQEISEFRTLWEMLHMYWLTVLLFQLWMVNNIIISILQMRSLRLTVLRHFLEVTQLMGSRAEIRTLSWFQLPGSWVPWDTAPSMGKLRTRKRKGSTWANRKKGAQISNLLLPLGTSSQGHPCHPHGLAQGQLLASGVSPPGNVSNGICRHSSTAY